MTNNFFLNAPELKSHLRHIVEHPGDPQYNSFIISQNVFGGTLALEWLRKELREKYPDCEFLYLQRYAISDFLRTKPNEMLTNYASLHPKLICVLLADLDAENLNENEQTKLALFLKSLTKRNIQVAASTSIAPHLSYPDGTALTPELWSWFMSGREYILKYNILTYTKDLTCSLTLDQDRKRFKLLSRLLRKSYHFGELYPGILTQDDDLDFNDLMRVKLGLCWLGTFKPPCWIFPRALCPNCGKIKLIPYSCIASVLSGGHVIKFYCLNCHERLATNDALDYFRVLRAYGTRRCYRAKQHNV